MLSGHLLLFSYSQLFLILNKMNKSKEFWDRASKNYDKTEERFEYIHDGHVKTIFYK